MPSCVAKRSKIGITRHQSIGSHLANSSRLFAAYEFASLADSQSARAKHWDGTGVNQLPFIATREYGGTTTALFLAPSISDDPACEHRARREWAWIVQLKSDGRSLTPFASQCHVRLDITIISSLRTEFWTASRLKYRAQVSLSNNRNRIEYTGNALQNH